MRRFGPALTALALIAVACGGGSEKAATTTSTPPSTTTSAPATTTTSPSTTTTTVAPYPYDFDVHADAPVLKPQTWHSAYAAVPWLIVQDGIWNLFYSGSKAGPGSLGWATSTDGVSWEKETLLTPLFSPGGGLGWFFIFETETNWEMLYVQGFSPPYRKVQRATAPELEGPWKEQGEAFRAPDREWDKFIVPTGVTKVGDRYLMPYGGWGQQNRVPAIGMLVSSDGLAWEPLFEEPIHVSTAGTWDEMGVVPMNIIETDRGLELFFLGFNEPPRVGYQADVIPFGRLVSTDDGATWEVDSDGGPIGDTGEKGWPGMAVVHDGERYWMYLGDDLGSKGISLLTGTIP